VFILATCSPLSHQSKFFDYRASDRATDQGRAATGLGAADRTLHGHPRQVRIGLVIIIGSGTVEQSDCFACHRFVIERESGTAFSFDQLMSICAVNCPTARLLRTLHLIACIYNAEITNQICRLYSRNNCEETECDLASQKPKNDFPWGINKCGNVLTIALMVCTRYTEGEEIPDDLASYLEKPKSYYQCRAVEIGLLARLRHSKIAPCDNAGGFGVLSR